MSVGPDFDELIGEEVSGAERERLRVAHAFLVAAGPPPELPPELEAGPTLRMTLSRRPREFRRRATLLLAAAIAVAAVFIGGYAVGNHNGGGTGVAVERTLQLQGNALAPRALASLTLQREDASGNWPMLLNVTGLPAPPPHGYYTVWLVRNGKPWAPCGGFLSRGPDQPVVVSLTAPYDLHQGDSWVVTLWTPGTRGAGRTVRTPLT